ncbi:hypothetical protein F0562_022327 [Nyssa sinensis]|uniref:Uncharacterized protein n=1 Tax=Nyssa sinensis TaxID=561372 RepID=A0A5J5BMD3_9ASTE|nr:hypothetical protein F0562_022327 [Nyssa sinensis]
MQENSGMAIVVQHSEGRKEKEIQNLAVHQHKKIKGYSYGVLQLDDESLIQKASGREQVPEETSQSSSKYSSIKTTSKMANSVIASNNGLQEKGKGKKKGKGMGRDLNNSLKQKEIRNIIRSQGLCILGILETKVKVENTPTIKDRCFNKWGMVHNGQDAGVIARISLGWNPQKVYLFVIKISDQAIFCDVSINNTDIMFCLEIVYGYNEYNARRHLWNDMNSTVKEVKVRKGEIKRGYHLTWSNKQEGEHNIACKLDRILANGIWLQNLTDSERVGSKSFKETLNKVSKRLKSPKPKLSSPKSSTAASLKG